MHYYFAPMEGVTGAVYRRTHHEFFSGVDKYFMPFITPTTNEKLTPRQKRDVLPEYNEGVPAVPQLLTKSAADCIWAVNALHDLGYPEVNLNLGCPSGTVTAKGKGAGFLAHPDELDRFFDEVFAKCEGISVKTRLGVHEASEFDKLLEIYNRYPITELTIHPRVRQDFYKGKVREEDFAAALPRCSMPVCYNGDLITDAMLWKVMQNKEGLTVDADHVVAITNGGGIRAAIKPIADPSLVARLTGGKAADAKTLETFHDTLFMRYCEAFGDSRIAMLRMKEIWFYHLNLFENSEKTGKAIKKAKNAAEFQSAAAAVFRDCRVRANVVPLWFKPA